MRTSGGTGHTVRNSQIRNITRIGGKRYARVIRTTRTITSSTPTSNSPHSGASTHPATARNSPSNPAAAISPTASQPDDHTISGAIANANTTGESATVSLATPLQHATTPDNVKQHSISTTFPVFGHSTTPSNAAEVPTVLSNDERSQSIPIPPTTTNSATNAAPDDTTTSIPIPVDPTANPTITSRPTPNHALSTFSLLNIAGLKPQTKQSKVPFIQDILRDKNQLFISLTETWLKKHTQAELSIDGYKLYRADRTGRTHTHGRYSGGVALYLRSDLAATSEQLLKFSNGVVEALVIHSKKENLLLAVIYRQPNSAGPHRSGAAEFIEALNEISSVLDSTEGAPDIIFSGDFNLPDMDWNQTNNGHTSNALHTALLDFQDKYFLSQTINKSTHSAGNTLDLIFTNNKNNLADYTSTSTILSDHFHVEVTTYFKSHFSRTQRSTRTFSNTFESLNFFSDDVDWDQLSNELQRVDWSTEFDGKDPDEQFNHLIDVCQNVSKQHVPGRRQATSSKKHAIPRDRRTLMRRRTKVTKQLAKHQPPSKRQQLTNELVEIELKLQDSIAQSTTSQEQKAVDAIRNNPKYFFTYVKKFCKVKPSIGPLLNKQNEYAVDNNDMANILSDQYSGVFSTPKDPHPDPFIMFNSSNTEALLDIEFSEQDISDAINELTINASAGPDGFPAILLKRCKDALSKPLYSIWRNCLDKGTTPQKAKQSTITPIHKGGSTANAANYRPIALTSHLVKIFEKVLRKRMVQYLDSKNLFNSSQHGFRAGRSCLSQLIAHYDKILTLLDQGSNVDVIYLDFAKAFDKLDINITLSKLKILGIDGKVGRWLQSFLTSRFQTVIVNGEKSSPAPVISGVPQGSVIGPLLFLILISDIDSNVASSFLSSFADDTRVGSAISSPEDANLLQRDLEAIYTWAETNNMLFNENKFELLRYGKNQGLKDSTQYHTSTGLEIEEKPSTKDLGVIMSSSADFKEQIDHIVEKVRDLSSWILRSFKSRSKLLLLQLWKSIVIPHLDYCSQLWNPQHAYLIKRLENLQKSFIRRIYGFKDKTYWEALEELGLNSLQRRRERYQIIYLWSIIEDIVPNIKTSSGDLIKIQSTADSRNGRTIQTKPLKNSRFSTLRFNSLPFHGARLFNKLPQYLRNITSCPKLAFKSTLDHHLKTVLDKPVMLPSTISRQVSSNSLMFKLNPAGPAPTSQLHRCGTHTLVGGR